MHAACRNARDSKPNKSPGLAQNLAEGLAAEAKEVGADEDNLWQSKKAFVKVSLGAFAWVRGSSVRRRRVHAGLADGLLAHLSQ